MSETFTIKEGDTGRGLEYVTSAYEDGSNVFAGATVRFLMARGATVKVNAPAVVHDADGVLRYGWQNGDVDTAGVYLAEFEVTYSDGALETFPSDGYITVTISQDLG